MLSFNIASKVDLQEVDLRYDLNRTHIEIDLQQDAIVILGAED